MKRRQCALLVALVLALTLPGRALGLTQVMLVGEEKASGLLLVLHLALDVDTQRFTVTQYDPSRGLGAQAQAPTDTQALRASLEQAGYACDAYVRVDVCDIAPMLELLGGITLPLSQEDLAWLREQAPGGAWPEAAGEHALDGAQFVWYLQRYLQDGKSASRRAAMLDAAVALSRNAAALPALSLLQCINLAVEMIDTDLSIRQMAQMAHDLSALRYVPVQWMTDPPETAAP